MSTAGTTTRDHGGEAADNAGGGMSGGAGSGGVMTAGPARERIEAIDSLRGFILLGILFMNMPGFGLPHQVFEAPMASATGMATQTDQWAWLVASVLWDGKMRAIFSMLFGAGAVLLTSRAEASGPEGAARSGDVYTRRMLWLMGFGVFDIMVLGWLGDILYWYGLVGLVLYPLRTLRGRTLIIAGALLLMVVMGIGVGRHVGRENFQAKVVAAQALKDAGKELTKEQEGKIEKYEEMRKKRTPKAEDVAKEVEARREGYFSYIHAIMPVAMEWNSQPIFVDGDILPMMILGMGLAHTGVITGRRTTRFYLLTATVCLPLGWWLAWSASNAWRESGFDPMYLAPLSMGHEWVYPAQRLLLALGYVSVVMLCARAALLATPMRWVAAAGRMPLTNYLGQSLICLFIFSGAGLGLFDKLSLSKLLLLAVMIWVPQVAFSVLWLQTHAFGPMEWFWRWMAYRKKPAWRVEARSSMVK